ncbi:MAG: hypothetical protein WAP23_03065 [Candidatus Spechtbacterales bacterium]
MSQIPRLLSSQDRNSFSPTYGCFNREFWLNRTRDFPDAIAQFSTLSLALVWAYKFPRGERYWQNLKIKEWVLAGIEYWIKIQHRDGSYDEFYPNERGWTGPTGFLLYAMLKSYELLGDEFPKEMRKKFFVAVRRSAWFLATREETGVLANHHAMALLPVYQSYHHLKNTDPEFAKKLFAKFEERLNSFSTYCYPEGWCLEYDGADPGYLSATVSFLSKMQKYSRDTLHVKIQEIIDRAIDFSSYFLYPNGSYGGTLGSRQTLHFYPHGYELQASNNPLASACAEFALQALSENKLVPPEIQDERYFIYRVPEYLEAYIDYSERPDKLPRIPCEKEPFEKYFEQAKILIHNTDSHYMLINFAKGGVLKTYSKQDKNLVFSDDGIVVRTNKGKTFTTQWIGKKHTIEHYGNNWKVRGNFHKIRFSYFSPITMIGFRVFMLLAGWNAQVADKIKGIIRKAMITDSSKAQISFEREFNFDNNKITIVNKIRTQKKIASIRIGGQFAVRYVPQSRYFQEEELRDAHWTASQKVLQMLNKKSEMVVGETFDKESLRTAFEIENEPN